MIPCSHPGTDRVRQNKQHSLKRRTREKRLENSQAGGGGKTEDGGTYVYLGKFSEKGVDSKGIVIVRA